MSDTEAGPGADPFAEGLGHSARSVAQLATAAMAAAQAVIRIRQQREAARASEDLARAGIARADLRADYADARQQWSSGLEADFSTGADLETAAGVWIAAEPWADCDVYAGQALAAAEDRLAHLHPDVMVHYHQFREGGMDSHDAMAGAAQAMRTLGEEQRFEAQRDLAPADVASTPQLDERSEGAERASAHLELSDAASAQAAGLVGQAYPQNIHQALQSHTTAAPVAARSSRPAAPAAGRRR